MSETINISTGDPIKDAAANLRRNPSRANPPANPRRKTIRTRINREKQPTSKTCWPGSTTISPKCRAAYCLVTNALSEQRLAITLSA